MTPAERARALAREDFRERYSFVDHIAMSLFGPDWGSGLMAIFTAFGDASGDGSEATNSLTVSANIACVDQWRKFREQWTEILEHFDVPYLHMKDFAPRQGPYKKWARKENDQGPEFVNSLIGVMARTIQMSFSRIVLIPEYDSINSHWRIREEVGPPFTLAAFACVGEIEKWRAENKVTFPVAYIFEKGDVGTGHLADMSMDHFQATVMSRPKVDPVTKEYIVEFQAADLVAYENMRTNNSYMQGGHGMLTQVHPAAGSLYHAVKNDWAMLRLPNLHHMCGALQVNRRES